MTGAAVNAATVAFKKALIERALGAELGHHLGYANGAVKPEAATNQRNGKSVKTVLTEDGPLRIEVPRDREGSFEPLLIPKHERRFTGFDDKILAMYARGMTMREVQGFLLESCVAAVSRRGDLQDLADRLDPVGAAVFVDKLPQDLSRRSSSAWAKNALASLRISLARRSSLTSRSSSLTRWASALVTPGRVPASTSWRCTHVNSVWGTQEIFGAIDSTAAHNDGYSPWCSCTSRTARSRTSGQNFFDLFMAPSSQELGPPQNAGRFMREPNCNFCGLTFELRGARRCGAWPARRMMYHSASRAKCHAGVRPLERRGGPHPRR